MKWKDFIALRSVAVLAICSLCVLAQAKDIHAPGETLLETYTSTERVRKAINSPSIIREAAFVYDLARDDFNLESFLEREAPHLLAYRQAILHWSGFASIHPRVVLALMEAHSQVVSSPVHAGLQRPFGDLSEKVGFDEQLSDVVVLLSQRFYNLKILDHPGRLSVLRPDASIPEVYDQRLAASLALASMGAAESRTLNAAEPLAGFTESYRRLFPEAASRLRRGADSQSEAEDSLRLIAFSALPPANLMQLPWHQGYWWIPNGAHAHTGYGFPLSSIDVSYDWPSWYSWTYSVAAAHSGVATVFSPCQVRVTHPSGWATNYYHLKGIQVSNGQWVERNTKLANYADEPHTALCQGGGSTGPHLHFSLLYNGVYHSLQDVNLGPYRMRVGQYSYDSNCYRFWLYNEYGNQRVCAWSSVYNYGARQ